jgi:hypothetical protein
MMGISMLCWGSPFKWSWMMIFIALYCHTKKQFRARTKRKTVQQEAAGAHRRKTRSAASAPRGKIYKKK